MQIIKVILAHVENHYNCYHYKTIIINLVLHLDIGHEANEIEN